MSDARSHESTEKKGIKSLAKFPSAIKEEAIASRRKKFTVSMAALHKEDAIASRRKKFTQSLWLLYTKDVAKTNRVSSEGR